MKNPIWALAYNENHKKKNRRFWVEKPRPSEKKIAEERYIAEKRYTLTSLS